MISVENFPRAVKEGTGWTVRVPRGTLEFITGIHKASREYACKLCNAPIPQGTRNAVTCGHRGGTWHFCNACVPLEQFEEDANAQ